MIKTNSPIGNVIIILLALIGAITLLFIWTDILSEAIYFKLLVTASIVVVLLGLIIAIKRDVDDDNKSKGDRFFN
jgi:hypothetical protein